jgi:3-oxoacyl-[acyl-carrier protein] reductase
MRLRDRVAIVTGGARGIGRATALALARDGARVVVNYARQAGAAREVVRAIASAGGAAVACRADVSRAAGARRLVDAALRRFGRLDILVNNAGFAARRSWRLGLDAIDPRDWDRAMAVDVRGALLCSQAAAPAMRRSGGGAIVNLSSSAALQGDETLLLYSAAKAALAGWTRNLALALAPSIRVNAVAPGSIATGWIADWKLTAADLDAIRRSTPLRRIGTPEDVAHAIAFLASDDARYTTGQVLIVDGGVYMA